MIELKNVSKIYKSKKSTDTMALKDISIKFPEKGMVFILGKSGSGKSTLLNIIGGLDKYDNGEVIINGKSTKKFKEKDFDAFRNTYMGFIFQEYNLLENYSIEQNIKLSLELQHKKVSQEQIQKALNQVELEDISKRKTNELSGGQKQRVAIARALIKEPEIILADEPTGNLDSKTSEQIWAILKKLSQDKLVIVVSHDTESAETYGDRIIELQDGEIIQDQGRTEITEKNVFKLKGAKLPFYYSFKMAIGSLVHKKMKLVFSTILITFSLICFGIMISAYTTNLNDETIHLFEEKGPTEIAITKHKVPIKFIEVMEEQRKNMAEQDLDKLQELESKYEPIELNDDFEKKVEEKTGLNWQSLYSMEIADGFNSVVTPSTLQNEQNSPVYYVVGSNSIDIKFVRYDDEKIENLIGTIPTNNNEIVISSYIADYIINKGCMAKNANHDKAEEVKYEPKNYNDILSSGKYINFGNTMYLKIVGIIDRTEDLKEYETFKNMKFGELYGNTSVSESYDKFCKLIYNNESRVYVSSSFIENLKSTKGSISLQNTKVICDSNTKYVNSFGYIDPSLEVITDKEVKTITSLNDNEIVINEAFLDNMDSSYYELYEKNANKYENKQEFIMQYLKDNKTIIGKTVKSNVSNGKIVDEENKYAEYIVVGVTPDETERSSTLITYYSKNVVENLMTSNIHCMSVNRPVNTIDEMKTILKYYPVEGSTEISSCEYSESAAGAASMAYFINYVAKYGVIFFLVFSAIILMTFINSSIRFRKKEIGTLRALGCRSKDIIVMFVYESIILMLISLGIAFVAIPELINLVNTFAQQELFMEVNILRFGIKQIVEISAIMLAIVILANVMPVRKITRMKPIDAILNK